MENPMDKYTDTIFQGEKLLKSILSNELCDIYYSFSEANPCLAGEAKGIKNMLYNLTGEEKYNWTLQQLQDHYREEARENAQKI